MEDVRLLLEEMVSEQCEEVDRVVKAWGEGKRRDLDGLEVGVREWALRVGLAVMQRLIQQIASSSSKPAPACPTCGKTMAPEGRKRAKVHTSLGRVEYDREYVRCRSCGEGAFPQDAEFHLDGQRNSPALQRIVSVAGSVAPFEKASDLLGEIGSIPLAASKVERITEQVGKRMQDWQQRRQQLAMAHESEKPSKPVERLYIEADGTTVPMRIQGARSKNQRTEGKVEYKEVKVGAVFEGTVDEDGRPQGGAKTYTGTFEDAEACVRQVAAEAKARGSVHAQEIVLLMDGGTWLWNRLPEAFAGKTVTPILDWCHPSERLAAIAKWIYGEGSDKAKDWARQHRDSLYEGRVQDVIKAIEGLKPRGQESKKFVRQSLEYFREHAHRMNYAELRAQGYFIGSGVIESACKHIVANRLKQAGMKWSRDHVPKILALRVARASGWWGNFWHDHASGAA